MLLGDIFKKVRSTLHAYKYYGKDNQSKQIYRPLWWLWWLLICLVWRPSRPWTKPWRPEEKRAHLSLASSHATWHILYNVLVCTFMAPTLNWYSALVWKYHFVGSVLSFALLQFVLPAGTVPPHHCMAPCCSSSQCSHTPGERKL